MTRVSQRTPGGGRSTCRSLKLKTELASASKEVGPRDNADPQKSTTKMTGSRPISEVKQFRAGLVLGRETTWEPPVL
uniref:Uncharacterized protein n=1 Tax=Tetranychus urticae TaxID=32264 RepID=T1K193_TETUR